jgi:hypothetical protein
MLTDTASQLGNCARSNDLLPLLPPKQYEAVFISHATVLYYGNTPKLVLVFRVVSEGKYHGVELRAYYGVKRLVGKIGKNGGFATGLKSKFLREYFTLFPDAPVPKRLDRIAMTPYQGKIFVIKTRTITKGADQLKIPAQLQYSVIDRILKVKPL